MGKDRGGFQMVGSRLASFSGGYCTFQQLVMAEGATSPMRLKAIFVPAAPAVKFQQFCFSFGRKQRELRENSSHGKNRLRTACSFFFFFSFSLSLEYSPEIVKLLHQEQFIWFNLYLVYWKNL